MSNGLAFESFRQVYRDLLSNGPHLSKNYDLNSLIGGGLQRRSFFWGLILCYGKKRPRMRSGSGRRQIAGGRRHTIGLGLLLGRSFH